MDIQQFTTNAELENDGIWIDGPDGARFKIRSSESKQYRRALIAQTKRIPAHRIRKDPEIQRKATIDAMAEAMLIDWDGVEESGKPLPCTPENRKRVLAIAEIRDLIATEAQDASNFQREAEAADAADLKSDG